MCAFDDLELDAELFRLCDRVAHIYHRRKIPIELRDQFGQRDFAHELYTHLLIRIDEGKYDSSKGTLKSERARRKAWSKSVVCNRARNLTRTLWNQARRISDGVCSLEEAWFKPTGGQCVALPGGETTLPLPSLIVAAPETVAILVEEMMTNTTWTNDPQASVKLGLAELQGIMTRFGLSEPLNLEDPRVSLVYLLDYACNQCPQDEFARCIGNPTNQMRFAEIQNAVGNNFDVYFQNDLPAPTQQQPGPVVAQPTFDVPALPGMGGNGQQPPAGAEQQISAPVGSDAAMPERKVRGNWRGKSQQLAELFHTRAMVSADELIAGGAEVGIKMGDVTVRRIANTELKAMGITPPRKKQDSKLEVAPVVAPAAPGDQYAANSQAIQTLIDQQCSAGVTDPNVIQQALRQAGFQVASSYIQQRLASFATQAADPSTGQRGAQTPNPSAPQVPEAQAQQSAPELGSAAGVMQSNATVGIVGIELTLYLRGGETIRVPLSMLPRA